MGFITGRGLNITYRSSIHYFFSFLNDLAASMGVLYLWSGESAAVWSDKR